MNILPHKSWHVRTKANIAKVRKDQAQAAAEEKEQERKRALAEQEIRLTILRNKSSSGKSTAEAAQTPDSDEPAPIISITRPWENEHINLFEDLDGTVKPNADYTKEKKDEQEKYEKQIGYLTYLGQDTNESTGRRDWYETVPQREDPHALKRGVEIGLKSKKDLDPLQLIRLHTGKLKAGPSVAPAKSTALPSECLDDRLVTVVRASDISARKSQRDDESHKRHKKSKKSDRKSKKHKHHSDRKRERRAAEREREASEKDEKLRRLRVERLARERREQERMAALLAPKEPEPAKAASAFGPPVPGNCKQKYNSQFNPYLAKQNYD